MSTVNVGEASEVAAHVVSIWRHPVISLQGERIGHSGTFEAWTAVVAAGIVEVGGTVEIGSLGRVTAARVDRR